ncbi:MAG: GspE/PulE family protein [Patescibacteria group bacterium]|jgi:type IV pilus assembly protein PilB
MQTDDSKPKSIRDLLSPQAKRRVTIASDEAQEQFQDKLHDIDVKEKEQITRNRAAEIGVSYINLKGFPIAGEVLANITEENARRLNAVCFLLGNGEVRLGSTDPTNPEVRDELNRLAQENHVHGDIYMISEYSLQQALKLYAIIPKPRAYVAGVQITEEDFKKYSENIKSFQGINESIQRVSISEIITLLIAGGIRNDASDIHIEAEENDIKVRYRMDGVLHDVASLPHSDWLKIISRIKLLAGLKINITTTPQDGRFTIHLTKGYIDVRVSCIPTTYGESVVMRLLQSSNVGVKFEDLGLRGSASEVIKREIDRPNGMILATGPTGSGKTTTLYAFLLLLNKPEVKIITLENPVEYKIPGINQSEVDAEAGYSFAKGLRSILRQDPDVVMVGEIRDPETAEIAVQAALTGHLMLSTTHTNNAAGTIPRLLSFGIVPYLLSPSLNVIIGQRLVRKICQYCKEPMTLDAATLSRVHSLLAQISEASGQQKPDPATMTFYRGKGCEHCTHIGYKGRIGIYEVFTMNTEIEQHILSGQVSENTMHDIAVKNGMITMVQDGLLKALDGITTVEEVFKVTE